MSVIKMNTRVAFDWEIRISDFAIEREIRKLILPPRNPSLGWISNNISNMRRSVSSPDETPRRELKIRSAAEYF